MKHYIAISIALASIAFAAAGEDAPTVVTASATLKDSSTVKGEFLTKRIAGSTLFLEKLDLDASLVKSVSFSGTNGESKVLLSNGDSFAMTISTKDFAIKSLLGDLSIPRENFRSLALSHKTAAEDESGLVFHCTFDSLDDAGCDQLAGRVKVCNAVLTDGKSGSALRVQRGLPAIEIRLPPGTFGSRGCIEFWAKLLDGKTEFSTGGDPRFFTLYKNSGGQFGHIEYASNSGNGNKGICSCLPVGFTSTHSGFTGMMPYSEIFHGKPYEDWHHYALVWNSHGIESAFLDGSKTIAIFLDGKSVGTVNTRESSDAMDFLHDMQTVMGIPMNTSGPSYNNKSSFLIDDLKIWNYDKTDFDLQQ